MTLDRALLDISPAAPPRRFVVGYQERLDAVVDGAESTIRALREQTGGPLDRVAWEPEVIAGDPAKAIAAVAAARHADEIVIPRGTAARPAAEAA